ncbi:copper-binding protein [Zavarzinia sp.]|uniref:copper-binding protein n=1 Tax=Zavarzinia sp. TaxID=2027920 RepID=UPI0035655316
MKSIALAAAVAALAAGSAAAQAPHHDHPSFAHATMAQASAAALADGEVRKVDKDAGKITLKHGPIKSLDMPPMTMVFQVKDRAFLDKVKAGDKVKFAAEEKAGAYIVTAIEASK